MTDTLATRLAERNRLRELRAERLARLRTAPAPADDAEAALEDFLRAVGGGGPVPAAAPAAAPAPATEPGAVLPFRAVRERPAPAPGDLDGLPGAGPGLVWALEQAGLRSLADLAPLAPGELAGRLGPIGRLVPTEAWIAAARAAAARTAAAGAATPAT
jgi:predicted flap endonuclease-1-like 5' DNA nuclease